MNPSTVFIVAGAIATTAMSVVLVRRIRFWDRVAEILEDPTLSDQQRTDLLEAHWANEPF